MNFLFQNDEFSRQLLHAISYASTGGARLAECLDAAARIRDGDRESWRSQWLALGDKARTQADQSAAYGAAQTARDAYLRASTYYRTAEKLSPRHRQGSQASAECFSRAASFFAPLFEQLSITSRPRPVSGYFFRVEISPKPRPALIAVPAAGIPVEEMYFNLAVGALAEGFHCICIERPEIIELSEWETIIQSVIDFSREQPEVDPRQLTLIGHWSATSFRGLRSQAA